MLTSFLLPVLLGLLIAAVLLYRAGLWRGQGYLHAALLGWLTLTRAPASAELAEGELMRYKTRQMVSLS